MSSAGRSEPEPHGADQPLRRLPAGIWVLGFASMFMDISSELVHSLLPIFMTGTLGASLVTVGIVEGVAEGTAAVTKVFSGVLSDFARRRKPLVVAGYALGALTKPVFPLAGSIGWVFGARFVDRIGKGVRGAPRDALVAEIAPPEIRGAAYGLRQALDSVGALVGPLLAILFLLWRKDDVRTALWIAVVPAWLAVVLLTGGIREPRPSQPAAPADKRLTPGDIRRLPGRYWFVVALVTVFTLARFSEAFLILRARDVGLAIGLVPAVMIVMNLTYAAGAFPAGVAADRVSPRTLLVAGLGMLVTADVVLALARAPLTVFLGAAGWGLHLALTQGLLAKLVADAAPAALRGTAFGVFNLAGGVALLLASVIAGTLWQAYGPSVTFGAGAAFAALAAGGVFLMGERPARGDG